MFSHFSLGRPIIYGRNTNHELRNNAVERVPISNFAVALTGCWLLCASLHYIFIYLTMVMPPCTEGVDTYHARHYNERQSCWYGAAIIHFSLYSRWAAVCRFLEGFAHPHENRQTISLLSFRSLSMDCTGSPPYFIYNTNKHPTFIP